MKVGRIEKLSDGGSAFPRPLPNTTFHPDEVLKVIEAHKGMTLRDYFAAAALTSYIGAEHAILEPWSDLAKDCYAAADAMLRARETK